MSGSKSTPEQWSAEAKLATLIETGSISEAELSEYCRERGLYVEKVKAWKAGARLRLACDEVVSIRTYKRCYRSGKVTVDGRPDCVPAEPINKLCARTQQVILQYSSISF